MHGLPNWLREEDIDEHAALILHNAVVAAKHILGRRLSMDRDGLRDAPLVVLVGEDHAVPDYRLYMMKLLDMLERHEKLMVCSELESSLVHEVYAGAVQQDFEIVPELSAMDHDGRLSVMSNIGFYQLQGAHHSQHMLDRYIMQRQLPVLFNDASVIENKRENALNINDPSTKASMQACLNGRVLTNLRYDTQAGMYVRNHHMRELAITAFAHHKPRIAVQQCGYIHVGGYDRYYPAAQSLAALFAEKGFCVSAPVMHDLVPVSDAALSACDLIKLPRFKDIYAFGQYDSYYPADAQITGHRAESLYSNAILQRIGMENDCVSDDERRRVEQSCEAKMTEIFKDIKNQRALKQAGYRPPSCG